MGVKKVFTHGRQSEVTVQAGTPMTVHEDGGAVVLGSAAFIFVP